MAKINIRSVIEVSHPDVYNIDRLRHEDMWLKCTKLSDAKAATRYLRLDKKPYVIITMSGLLDDDVRKEKMRLFVIFSPVKCK